MPSCCRAISDSWLGAEAFLTISFKSLILPEKHPPHTELLDLDPLPVTALNNPQYEAMYRFSHLSRHRCMPASSPSYVWEQLGECVPRPLGPVLAFYTSPLVRAVG